MRTISILVAMSAATLAAQQSNPPATTYTTAAEVQAMIAKAAKERKPDQANFIQTIAKMAPYSVNLEYRVKGVDSPATVHETQAELVYVVDGAATLVTGGKLIGETRTNATNLAGKGIEGGSPRRIAKGDFILIPEKTPHAFTRTEDRLVIMSIHLPMGEGR